MRLTLTFLLLIFLNIIFVSTAKKLKDADFSEFDNFDDDEFAVESPLPSNANPSNKVESISSDSSTTSNKNSEETIVDVTVDDEDDDDDRMFDDEEFENTESFSSSSSTPDLKFTEVPSNLTGNRWEAYYCEGIMIIAVLGYLINFLLGRSKNARLASNIYRSQSDLLEKNFSLIGDNGQTRTAENNDEQTNNDLSTTNLQKESENLYILWCSGRISIESMLMEIRFIKRQCLFNSLAALIKSINDTIVYTIDFSKDDMETFVFCLAKKRSAIRLHRDMNDLSQFCAERKNADRRGLTSGNYQILSEFGEVTSAIVDNRLVDFIDKYPDALEYIHITDQYTGSKNQNENLQSNTTNAPQQQDALNASERAVRRVLIVAFNLLARDDRSLQVTSEYVASDYLRLVLHLIDRVSSYRFQSKETKLKANKNRQRIEEQFLKNVYQQRQEQAQQRREEKRRAEKEKIMQSDDSERQRKWEEKEHKRELKRRQPKMKQMKVKSM